MYLIEYGFLQHENSIFVKTLFSLNRKLRKQSAKDLLTFLRSPVDSDFFSRSLPARSTSVILLRGCLADCFVSLRLRLKRVF